LSIRKERGCVADPATRALGSPAPGNYGAGIPRVRLTEIAIAGAWNLQGPLAQAPFAAATRALCGVALPEAPNTTAQSSAVTACWLGPEAWLLIARGAGGLADLAASRAAINAVGGALFDVSASRVAYRIGGKCAAHVLAKNCPLDFDSRAFAIGGCAQSLFGQSSALFHHLDATSWIVMVARSFARDAWQTLCASAVQYGYEVTTAEPFP
jgi:sarcosine oxidase subunit gamma